MCLVWFKTYPTCNPLICVVSPRPFLNFWLVADAFMISNRNELVENKILKDISPFFNDWFQPA